MPPHGSEEFSDLLRRAIRQEPDAVAEIYRRYESRVRTRVRQRLTPVLRRQYDTVDIGQSVFADVLRDLPEFEDRGESAFLHWLYVRAERKVNAKQRRSPRARLAASETGDSSAQSLEVPCPYPGPSEQATAAEESRRLGLLLSDLAEQERRVIELRTQEKATFREIAEHLGMPTEDAARKCYARALKKLEGRWDAT